jgi:hypothetical protein
MPHKVPPNHPNFEELRQILEREQGRRFTTVEAETIGRGLIRFYENLLDNSLGYGRGGREGK